MQLIHPWDGKEERSVYRASVFGENDLLILDWYNLYYCLTYFKPLIFNH